MDGEKLREKDTKDIIKNSIKTVVESGSYIKITRTADALTSEVSTGVIVFF